MLLICTFSYNPGNSVATAATSFDLHSTTNFNSFVVKSNLKFIVAISAILSKSFYQFPDFTTNVLEKQLFYSTLFLPLGNIRHPFIIINIFFKKFNNK